MDKKKPEPKEKKKKADPISFNFPPIDFEALKKVPTFTIEISMQAEKPVIIQ